MTGSEFNIQHESKIPSCLISIVQAAGCVVMEVWTLFAHLGPLSTNLGLLPHSTVYLRSIAIHIDIDACLYTCICVCVLWHSPTIIPRVCCELILRLTVMLTFKNYSNDNSVTFPTLWVLWSKVSSFGFSGQLFSSHKLFGRNHIWAWFSPSLFFSSHIDMTMIVYGHAQLRTYISYLGLWTTMNIQSALNKEVFIPRDEQLLVAVEVRRRKRKRMSFLPTGAKGDYTTFICVSG